MYLFAQTNLQLFHQLHHANYAETDLVCINRAYHLASQIFTGFFRGSGKPFIAHLVGTASILASVNAPIDLIAGGLLHAVYELGDFGDGGRGMTHQKQQQVRQVVGEAIENYVARYTALKWQKDNIVKLHRHLGQLNPQQKEVLLMRLANELEDHLQGGILYCGNVQKRLDYLGDCGHLMVEMAKELGYPQLATTLNQVFQETFSLQVPTALHNQHSYSYVLTTSSPFKRFMGQKRHRLVYYFNSIFKQADSSTSLGLPNF